MLPALADRRFTQLLSRHQRYGPLPIGTEGALRSLMIRDITAFHRRAFIPSRTTVIAVGDRSHDALLDATRRAFEGWTLEPSEPVADPDAFAPPAPPRTRLAVVHRSGSAQSELRIGHVALSRRTPDYHGALVLNIVLGGQFVSRINMNLREDKGYTYGARTSFDFRRGPGPFVLSASVQSEVTVEAALEALNEMQAIRGDRPVTAAELQTARA